MNKHLRISDLSPGTVLSGALRGQELLAKLLPEAAAEPSSPQPLYLDFFGIEAATASFLRESVLAFRDIVRSRRSTVYPVVANANELVQEDLREVIRSRGGVLLTCSLSMDGTVSAAGMIGELDPKQQLTFNLVCKRGQADAQELMREYGANEPIGVTAWNNRLSSLVALGVLIEDISTGRTKRYRPLLAGI
ncbi:hypothetical protein SAMN05444167_1809 [Terriglobus roseus]|uniref:DUF4325 domain-containing protein n=2 Tax=Terriglobus roseus TaxID=392734 RepID=A0A1G7JHA2_9BACT|nr:hypothetical protein SAMN05444167_1809 [Terriglobus roseus]